MRSRGLPCAERSPARPPAHPAPSSRLPLPRGPGLQKAPPGACPGLAGQMAVQCQRGWSAKGPDTVPAGDRVCRGRLRGTGMWGAGDCKGPGRGQSSLCPAGAPGPVSCRAARRGRSEGRGAGSGPPVPALGQHRAGCRGAAAVAGGAPETRSPSPKGRRVTDEEQERWMAGWLGR